MAEGLQNENLDGPFKKSVEDGTEDRIEDLVREEVDENHVRLVRKRSLTKVDRSFGPKKTLLHTAVDLQRMEVIKSLLQNGANPNFLDAKSKSPFHQAILQNKTNIAIMMNYQPCN